MIRNEDPEILRVLQGDALEKLREVPSESVQCCVTSPPYWGLRDYGANGQIGLEETPGTYVAKMVEVFREVWRVLRDDGTLWLNLGDSYSGNGGYSPDAPSNKAGSKQSTQPHALQGIRGEAGLRPKNLIGIPWRVAFALQTDGWYLRSDIIWAKPNPMPESVSDRPTKSHEYIFLLTKSERYYYDAEAIAEPFAGVPYVGRENGAILNGDRADRGRTIGMTTALRNKRSVWAVATAPYPEAHFATYPPDLIKPCILAGTKVGDLVLDPFAGSGTTGMVAIELARKAILIELNPDYISLIKQRCAITPGLPLANELRPSKSDQAHSESKLAHSSLFLSDFVLQG